jgi:hypothetical protein
VQLLEAYGCSADRTRASATRLTPLHASARLPSRVGIDVATGPYTGAAAATQTNVVTPFGTGFYTSYTLAVGP